MSDDFELEDENLECEVCGSEIVLDDEVEEDDIIYCEECEAEYLITSVNPITLSPLDEDDLDPDLEEGDLDDYYDDYE